MFESRCVKSAILFFFSVESYPKYLSQYMLCARAMETQDHALPISYFGTIIH